MQLLNKIYFGYFQSDLQEFVAAAPSAVCQYVWHKVSRSFKGFSEHLKLHTIVQRNFIPHQAFLMWSVMYST